MDCDRRVMCTADDGNMWVTLCALKSDAIRYVPATGRRWRCALAVRHPGFRVLARWRLAAWLHSRGIPGLPQLLRQSLVSSYGCDISLKARIQGGVRLPHPVGIVIGDHVSVAADCTIMQSVTLGGRFGNVARKRATPQLMTGAFVGPGAVVLGPIVVGACARVRANAVVTRSIEPREH